MCPSIMSAIGIVQDETDMIEADHSAKRFGYARKQGVKVSSARNRSRKRQNSLIDIA